jgi:hypothetical protein
LTSIKPFYMVDFQDDLPDNSLSALVAKPAAIRNSQGA